MKYIFSTNLKQENGVELLFISFTLSVFVSESDNLEVVFNFSLANSNHFEEIEIYDIFKEEVYAALGSARVSKSLVEIQVESVTVLFDSNFYTKENVEKIIKAYIGSQLNFDEMIVG